MARRGKVIVSCAVTGSIHVPTVSEYLPITPEEIADSAIGAAEAGAAIVHLHARDPVNGRPTPDPEIFAQFLPKIRHGCDAVINITTGGGQGMTLEERSAAARVFKPELCSMNMGSMNFGLFPVLDRVAEFKHSWERDHLEASRDFIFRNTFKDIERLVTRAWGERHQVRVRVLRRRSPLQPRPLRGPKTGPAAAVRSDVFGILGGIGPEAENLMHMKATADRLFGEDYYWSVLGAGRHQTSLVTMSAILGGSVRVGLEDSIYLAKGELAKSNADQVAKICRILTELSLEIASPHEARHMLGLKGAAETAIPDLSAASAA